MLKGLIPFRGLRFNPAKVGDLSRVVAPPYDVINPAERERLYDKSPHNVVRLILSKEPYDRVAALLKQWIQESVLTLDSEPGLYLYEQQFDFPTRGTLTRRGFIGLRRLEPLGGEVVPHEATLSGPKADRLELIRACRTNLSPLFSLYEDREQRVVSMLGPHYKSPPLIDLRDDLAVRHRFWRVTNPETLRTIGEQMEGKRLFIADGHHRYETALTYRDETRRLNPGIESAPYDYVLMFYAEMGDPGLLILPTHRVLKNIAVPPSETLRKKLPPGFQMKPSQTATQSASQTARERYSFDLLFPKGKRYEVSWDPEELSLPLRKIGTAVLHEILLKQILGMNEEEQKDPRSIEFIKEEAEVVAKLKQPGVTLGVFLRAPRMSELQEVAGQLLPPKTTFFYPKLLTGLVFHPLF